MNIHRKDIHLSLSNDQYDDLTSALEIHRKGLQQFADKSENGFGLGPEYWSGRVADVQKLLEAVHRLAAGESPDQVKRDLQKNTQQHPHEH